MHPVRVTLTAVVISLGVLGQLRAEEAPESAYTVIRGDGGWTQGGRTDAPASQRWNMDAVRFADDQISGRIAVSGSPLIESANVEGRFSGRGLAGRLLDDEGKELAEFEGRVTASGASGTYRDHAGGAGEWTWEGNPPAVER